VALEEALATAAVVGMATAVDTPAAAAAAAASSAPAQAASAVAAAGLNVPGLKLRVKIAGSGFRAWGLGYRVQGSRFCLRI